MAENDRLPPRQQRVIAALLTNATIGAAATAGGVSETTIRRYLREDAFKAALRAAQDEAVATAVSRLAGEAAAAVQTLATIHKDREVPAAVRVQAARGLLAELLRIREQHDLTERLGRLEEKLLQEK